MLFTLVADIPELLVELLQLLQCPPTIVARVALASPFCRVAAGLLQRRGSGACHGL